MLNCTVLVHFCLILFEFPLVSVDGFVIAMKISRLILDVTVIFLGAKLD